MQVDLKKIENLRGSREISEVSGSGDDALRDANFNIDLDPIENNVFSAFNIESIIDVFNGNVCKNAKDESFFRNLIIYAKDDNSIDDMVEYISHTIRAGGGTLESVEKIKEAITPIFDTIPVAHNEQELIDNVRFVCNDTVNKAKEIVVDNVIFANSLNARKKKREIISKFNELQWAIVSNYNKHLDYNKDASGVVLSALSLLIFANQDWSNPNVDYTIYLVRNGIYQTMVNELVIPSLSIAFTDNKEICKNFDFLMYKMVGEMRHQVAHFCGDKDYLDMGHRYSSPGMMCDCIKNAVSIVDGKAKLDREVEINPLKQMWGNWAEILVDKIVQAKNGSIDSAAEVVESEYKIDESLLDRVDKSGPELEKLANLEYNNKTNPMKFACMVFLGKKVKSGELCNKNDESQSIRFKSIYDTSGVLEAVYVDSCFHREKSEKSNLEVRDGISSLLEIDGDQLLSQEGGKKLAGFLWDTATGSYFNRGQAAITMILMKSIAKSKGVELSFSESWTPPNASYDMQALACVDRDDFVRNGWQNIILKREENITQTLNQQHDAAKSTQNSVLELKEEKQQTSTSQAQAHEKENDKQNSQAMKSAIERQSSIVKSVQSGVKQGSLNTKTSTVQQGLNPTVNEFDYSDKNLVKGNEKNIF